MSCRKSTRLLIKAASGVPCLRRSASRRQVAALRGSTYGREYAFASSLAAALLDGLSEQPANNGERVYMCPIPYVFVVLKEGVNQ
jgi:hypothetical protein